MIAADISRWMHANGSFLEGLGYCQQVNPAAYGRLSRWKSATLIPAEVKAQLVDALRAHAASAPHPPTTGNTETFSYNPNPGGNAPIAPAFSEPPEVKELRRHAIVLHKQYAELKARLCVMSEEPDKYTAEERYNICREIMEDVIPATDDIYEQIRSYEDTGTLPIAGSNATRRETIEQYNQVLSLRPRISKVRKWLSEGQWPRKVGIVPLTPQDRAALETELAEKEQLLETLEIQLGLDG